jgi:hypothetical protein
VLRGFKGEIALISLSLGLGRMHVTTQKNYTKTIRKVDKILQKTDKKAIFFRG